MTLSAVHDGTLTNQKHYAWLAECAAPFPWCGTGILGFWILNHPCHTMKWGLRIEEGRHAMCLTISELV